MDSVDAQQQSELDQLHEHARDNRTTDRLQWLGLIAALALSAYTNIILGGAIKAQSATIEALRQICK